MTAKYRVYDDEGRVKKETNELSEILGEQIAESYARPDDEIYIYLADSKYDEPDYNPMTGELYTGVINEEQILVATICDGEVEYE